MSKDKAIFVTGATGLLGSYLLRDLIHHGYSNIKALRRKESSMALVDEVEDKVEWVEGDILDSFLLEDAMEEGQQVYHCAALVSYDSRDVRAMHRVNKEGTATLVNVALQRGIEKMVHVSSIAAVGRRKKQKIINEETIWLRSKWNSPYARSKQQAEMEVWRGIGEGLNAAIVNPSVILGSGLRGKGVGQLFQKIGNGFPFYPPGGTGFVDVRDVVRFMIRLMESDISGERFILNGENRSYKSLFDAIANAVDKKPPEIKSSYFLNEILWRLEWFRSRLSGKPTFITRETARNSARTFIYENRKSLKAFDFQYTPIGRTIEEMGKQFLETSGMPDCCPMTKDPY